MKQSVLRSSLITLLVHKHAIPTQCSLVHDLTIFLLFSLCLSRKKLVCGLRSISLSMNKYVCIFQLSTKKFLIWSSYSVKITLLEFYTTQQFQQRKKGINLRLIPVLFDPPNTLLHTKNTYFSI